MKKSYSKSLIFNIAADAVLVALWIILVIYDRLKDPGLFPILPVMCGSVAVWAILYFASSTRNYRQWNNIWKDPLWLSISSITLAVIVLAMIFLSYNSFNNELILLILLVGVLIRDIINYKRALKYDMDELNTIEELVRLHPESERDLTKRALRKARGVQP